MVMMLFSEVMPIFANTKSTVTSFEELKDIIDTAPSDGTEFIIELGADIEFKEKLTIRKGQNIVIIDDGNSRTIFAASRVYTAFLIEEGGTLTMKTSEQGNDDLLWINGENFHSNGSEGASIALVKGIFNLHGGTISNSAVSESSSGTITVFGEQAEFNMYGGTIKDNRFTSQYGGVIFVADGATFNMHGGVISNNDTTTDGYTVNNATVYVEAKARSGQDYGDSSFHMYGGTITENKAAYGGVFLGEAAFPDFASLSEMTMHGGATISKNIATGQGGGGVIVCGQADFTMEGGIIKENIAYMGGGVCTYDFYDMPGVADNYDIEEWSSLVPAKFTMNGGTIEGNQAIIGSSGPDRGCGGGIYVASNKVTLNGGYIIDNVAERQGGGVYVGTIPYVMKIYDALITDNTASLLGGGLWLCPTGATEISVTNGAGIYDNTSNGAGDDVVSVKTGSQQYILTLADRIIGGGQTLWYKDGGLASDGGILGKPDGSPRYDANDTPISGIKDSAEPHALKAIVSDSAKGLAEDHAKLFITGNHSERGGGIGPNGGIVIGRKNREYTLKVEKEWKETEDSLKQSVTVYLKVGETVLDPVILSSTNNWQAEFKGLPDPATLDNLSYAVVENPVPDDFKATYQKAIVDHTNRIITIKLSNTYTPSNKDGGLTILKTVTGNAGDTKKAFTFNIKLIDGAGKPVTGTFPYTGKSNVSDVVAPKDGDITFDANGEASISFSHGQSITISKLPAGVMYTVTEVEANQDGYTTTSSGANGITSENGVTAFFVNKKDDSYRVVKTGVR